MENKKSVQGGFSGNRSSPPRERVSVIKRMKNRDMLYMIGRPFSPFYSLAMRWRESLYRYRILPSARMAVPVISIGNLTLGGSGKTPVVQSIAEFLRQKGWSPAVISRGYGGKAGAPVNIVSDGRQVLLEADAAGDEPRLLAEKLPGIPVLTGTRRKNPARRAVEMGADILVLDDGFQHLALARDLDLVLFNADFLAGNSRVFPGGDLREPVQSLNRCHGFVMTGVCERNRDRAEQFRELLHTHFPDHPVFMADYRPAAIRRLDRSGIQEGMRLEDLRKVRLFGFSGIAHPENFRETLGELGLAVLGYMSFPDHHPYSREDLENMAAEARQMGAEACITTEKDMIKLARYGELPIPIYGLQMEVILEKELTRFLLDTLREPEPGKGV